MEKPPYPLKQESAFEWSIPASAKAGMRVPAKFISSKKLMEAMEGRVFEQLVNVASLPGVVKHALVMPDTHSGYGFPIGAVVAFDADTGFISPGAVGYDINCGMRLAATNLSLKEVRPRIKELMDVLYKKVPVGVGGKSALSFSDKEFHSFLTAGVPAVIAKGFGWKKDVACIESKGVLAGADPKAVSSLALQRGKQQLGTLGSGNHYLEIQHVAGIDDRKTAKAFGITGEGQIVVMFHCGSRGFGHQIATDYLQLFEKVMPQYGIIVPERELALAPFHSAEGQQYFKAMQCAGNYAYVNRQIILHRVREAFSEVFGKEAEDLGMHLVYDVSHNLAKLEEHVVDGKKKTVLVHRKGATRSFPPQHKDLPSAYTSFGQPVIIGGSMETGSYLLHGTEKAMQETFGTTCHGSGRTMSRAQALRQFNGKALQESMQKKGIYVKTASLKGLAEEAGGAYKNISDVVQAVHDFGISKKVAALKPLGNIKG